MHVVGRLDVCCREARYGRLVSVEGWGVLVSWGWGGLYSDSYEGIEDYIGKK